MRFSGKWRGYAGKEDTSCFWQRMNAWRDAGVPTGFTGDQGGGDPICYIAQAFITRANSPKHKAAAQIFCLSRRYMSPVRIRARGRLA